jgi:hypothetical protein
LGPDCQFAFGGLAFFMPKLGFNTDKENVMYAVHDLFSEQHFGKKVQINNTGLGAWFATISGL